MRTPVLALVLALAAVVLAQPAKDKKEGPRILVVQIERLIDDTEEGQALVKKLINEKAEAEKRLAAEQAALAQKRTELGKVKMANRDEAFYAELEKAMEEHARIEKEKQLFVIKKSDEISRATKQLMLLAMETADQIRRERGAEIVLASRMGPLDITGDQGFQQELLMRRVLCAGKDADITDEVIVRMNKWYRENKRGDGSVDRAGKAPGKDGAKASG